MPSDVYRAAKAIAAACKDGARFVGFSEDVADAIAKLAEPRDGARRPAPVMAAGANTNGSPHAYGAVAPDLGAGVWAGSQDPEPRNQPPDSVSPD